MAGASADDLPADSVIVSDVTPLSLGIVSQVTCNDGANILTMSTLIMRNSVIPTMQENLYETSMDDQTEVSI